MLVLSFAEAPGQDLVARDAQIRVSALPPGPKDAHAGGGAIGRVAGSALGLATRDDGVARVGAAGAGLLLGVAIGTAVSH